MRPPLQPMAARSAAECHEAFLRRPHDQHVGRGVAAPRWTRLTTIMLMDTHAAAGQSNAVRREVAWGMSPLGVART